MFGAQHCSSCRRKGQPKVHQFDCTEAQSIGLECRFYLRDMLNLCQTVIRLPACIKACIKACSSVRCAEEQEGAKIAVALIPYHLAGPPLL